MRYRVVLYKEEYDCCGGNVWETSTVVISKHSFDELEHADCFAKMSTRDDIKAKIQERRSVESYRTIDTSWSFNN